MADIFRHRGPAWRQSHAGHVSLGQLKVMSAIESCRTAALGGHVERCEDCAHLRIAYNSCGNRHCPKCQAAAAKEWLAEREAELLPVPYFHVVFTLPAPIADIAYQNKAVVYDLLLKTAAETLITIAADPKHLGARIGLTAVLHTWGSALTHHPHAHIIVPGGGFSPRRRALDLPADLASFCPCGCSRASSGACSWKSWPPPTKPGGCSSLPIRPPSPSRDAFARTTPLRKVEWVVYAKRPFGGPEAVLAYLSRYTHRIAIANSRLVAFDGAGVTFKWKDYRAKARRRYKVMTLDADEFIRRFLIHVLPDGFHRIRHYGLFANANRAGNIALARQLLGVPDPPPPSQGRQPAPKTARSARANTCPCCGGRMIIIETFEPGSTPRDQQTAPIVTISIDTS